MSRNKGIGSFGNTLLPSLLLVPCVLADIASDVIVIVTHVSSMKCEVKRGERFGKKGGQNGPESFAR